MDSRKPDPDVIKKFIGVHAPPCLCGFDDILAQEVVSTLRLYRDNFSSVVCFQPIFEHPIDLFPLKANLFPALG
jgi:hypothetical protein